MDSEVVTIALQKARFPEIVQITIDQDRVISLIACLDETNGGIQWNPLPENDTDRKSVV